MIHDCATYKGYHNSFALNSQVGGLGFWKGKMWGTQNFSKWIHLCRIPVLGRISHLLWKH